MRKISKIQLFENYNPSGTIKIKVSSPNGLMNTDFIIFQKGGLYGIKFNDQVVVKPEYSSIGTEMTHEGYVSCIDKDGNKSRIDLYSFIDDSFIDNIDESRIDEKLSLKDFAIGVMAMIGVLQSGDVDAQVDKLKNKQQIEQIKNILTDTSKLNLVINKLDSVGMKDIANTIESNSKEVIDGIEKISKIQKVGTVSYNKISAGSDINKVKSLLEKGWALSKIEADTLKKYIMETDQKMEVVWVDVDMSTSTDKKFEQGSFELTDEGKDEIKSMIEGISSVGGVIGHIEVESSTDKQRVSDELNAILTSRGYDKGNEGLSQARNDSYVEVIKEFLGDTISINQSVLFEQGGGELGATTPQDPEARYVKLKISYFVVEVKGQANPEAKTFEEIITYNFELTKDKSEAQVKPVPPKKYKIKINKPNIKTNNSSGCPALK